MRLFVQRFIVMLATATLSAVCCGQLSVSASAMPNPILILLREGLDGAINEWSGPAKFALYEDGYLFTETSNETSENSGEPRYFRTHLAPAKSKLLTQSLDVNKVIGVGTRE